MPKPIKFKKKHFIALFFVIVGVLWGVRIACPEISENYAEITEPHFTAEATANNDSIAYNNEFIENEVGDEETAVDTITIVQSQDPIVADRILRHSQQVDTIYQQPRADVKFVDYRGRPIKNKVKGVSSYVRVFNDLNDVQIATASRLGIEKIADREAAAQSKDSLVYVGNSPYYTVKELTHSIPYLVPRAAICLEEIARAFMDSCVIKGLPMHKVVLTSVLRTEKDVKKLRRVNANASSNSCHQHGTTFDISYNHFVMVQDPNAAPKHPVPAYRLKQILAEVLEDQREMGTCYVKYEHRRSACFHITAR